MNRENIEAVYRLTGLQESFLYHHLQAASGDQGIIQLHTEVEGELPVHVLKNAWKTVIASQPTLRTSFHWKDIKHPVQAVHRKLDVDCEVEDWSEESQDQVTSKWTRLLKEDRAKGLDLTDAPVFRITLVKLGSNQLKILWTCHHILLDGWSSATILKDVFDFCNAHLAGKDWHPITATPFKEYVRWEQSLPIISHSKKWRKLIAEHYQHSLFFAHAEGPSPENLKTRNFDLANVSREQLIQSGNVNRVTSTTLLITAWAILLSKLKECSQCLMGLTVSGRIGPFLDSPSMIGMFANSIPFPIHAPPEISISNLIQQVFETQESLQPLETSPAAHIHKWCNLPARQKLFDTLLIIDNYPVSEFTKNDLLNVKSIEGQMTSQVPLTVAFSIRKKVSLQVLFDSQIFDAEWIDLLGTTLESIIEAILRQQDDKVSDLTVDLPKIDQQGIDHFSPGFQSKPHEDVENLEQGLIRDLWMEILGLEEIGPHDNFFDLGGNSLKAANLIESLQQVFQKPIPLNILFETPTVAEMSQALISDVTENWPILIPLQKGGNRPPLFLFHEMGVSIFHYLPLIRHLPEDLPVYGVQAPFEAIPDLRSMTDFYLKEISNFYPEGPLLLGGYCFGGMLAYDMAQVLHEQGNPAEKVFIIELAFANIVRFRPRYLWNILKTETPKQHLTRTVNKISTILSRTLRMLKPGGQGFKDEAKDHFDTSLLPETTRLRTENYFRVARDYHPKPYPGDLVVLLCDNVFSQRDPFAGWDLLTGGKLDLCNSPSDHHSILDEPYVSEVADLIIKHLNEENP